MIDTQFLPIFLDEAIEILERWEAACLAIETSPSSDILNDLFRSAHNIKGSSKSVGLSEFSALVHKAEDVITRMKSGDLRPAPEVVAALLDCQNLMVEWIENLRSNPDHVCDTTAIIRALLHVSSPKISPNTEENPGFGFFDEIPNNSEMTLSNTTKPKDLGSILIDQGKVTAEQVEAAVGKQNRKIGEVLIESGTVSHKDVNAALEQQKNMGHKPDETIRVALRKLDSLIRLIGELSIQHAIVRNAKDLGKLHDSTSTEAINLSHKVIQDLQSEAMSLRMQSLEGFFQRMERVCRDVARQLKKPITVVLKGTEVELDKTVIERIKDPMVHILRNAVDHGIEDSDLRLKSGKQEAATVTIEALQTAANVAIKISDDGRGLNCERILQKARDKGLIPANLDPSPDEIYQMIFLPGFSTAEKVTDVSGRGVGLDVVKRAVDELNGSIHIESTPGKGTSFIISLPSTLSILDAVIIDLRNQLYSVPVQDIEEVVDLSTAQIETTTQKGRVLNLRGKVLPVERLASYLPIAPSSQKEASQMGPNKGIALITRVQTTTVAFEVDRVVGQQSIVVRQLEGKLAQVPGFAGGTILANGEPSMIVHLPHVVNSYISLATKQA